MAVMPSISYTTDTSSMTPVAPHYSSKFMDTNPSGLDPNASVYQPLKKWPLCSIASLFFFFFGPTPRPPDPAPFNLLGMSAAENVFLGSFFPPSLPGQKDVVLCVVQTKDEKKIKADTTSPRKSQFFFSSLFSETSQIQRYIFRVHLLAMNDVQFGPSP